MREYGETDNQYGDMAANQCPDVDIPALGRDCAIDAIEASGSNPTDADGDSLLPAEPQAGDWEALEEQIRRCCGRKPTADERDRFDRSYSAAINAHPGPECACKYCRADSMFNPGDICPVCGEGRIYAADSPAENKAHPEAQCYCDSCGAEWDTEGDLL